jgi:hypothetical protein
MLLNPGKMWKMARKPGGGAYVRSSTAVHTSPRVKQINQKFSKAAQDCKGKKGPEFRTCVADKLRGQHAS